MAALLRVVVLVVVPDLLHMVVAVVRVPLDSRMVGGSSLHVDLRRGSARGGILGRRGRESGGARDEADERSGDQATKHPTHVTFSIRDGALTPPASDGHTARRRARQTCGGRRAGRRGARGPSHERLGAPENESGRTFGPDRSHATEESVSFAAASAPTQSARTPCSRPPCGGPFRAAAWRRPRGGRRP